MYRILKSFASAVCALVSTRRRDGQVTPRGRSSGRRLAARLYHALRRLSVRYQTLRHLFQLCFTSRFNAGDVPMTATMSARRQSSALASLLSG
jgi:hypothetical protein